MQNIKLRAKKEFDNDLDQVKRKLRSVQSRKSRHKKKKGTKDYDVIMKSIVAEEQVLKEIRDMLAEKPVFVTEMTQEDIAKLNYEETLKAIKSIQSAKCNRQHTDDGSYEEAVKIEEMLLEHKTTVKPVPENMLKMSTLQHTLRNLEKLDPTPETRAQIELLKKLIKTGQQE